MTKDEGGQKATEEATLFHPGDVIAPGSAPPAAEAAPATPTEQPAVPPKESTTAGPGTVTWTASEFVAHDKSASWYMALAAIAVVVAALVFLLTKDKISTAAVIVVALVLGVYGARQPRQLEYRLDQSGLTIGQKTFSYSAFRSFAIVDEGALSSIVLLPLKRFSPLTTIYFAPDDEEEIVGLLGSILPLEERKNDPVDTLMRRIRF